VAIVVDVGGADGIDPCRNITVRASVCGIADVIVPRRNIVVRNVILRFGPIARSNGFGTMRLCRRFGEQP
jgi:hypothetical protein